MDCGKPRHGAEHLTGENQDTWKSPVRSTVRKDQEAWNVGAGSGRRDRRDRWDREEMRTATTKVRREIYEVFRALCKERKTTPYAVLRDFLLAYVDHFGGG